MRAILASIVMGLAQLCVAEGPVIIPDPRVQVVAAAQKQLFPGLKRAGNSIVEIPRQLGQCFRLPLGLFEVLLSPLPDIEFKEGVGDLGSGIVAPFKFCIAVCEMPYEVYRGLSDVVSL